MATAPTLAVNITAIDGVTKTINGINARMAAFSAPMEKLGKSVSKFGDVSGLNRMGRAFGNIATEATGAFQAVGQIVAPLGIISGAASIAGIYRMVSAWSEWGTHLGNAATRIGISAQALSGFQGAARLAGVSSDTMTAGLQGLGQTMFDMVGGRAPEAVAMFNTLGISFRDASGHARSAAEAYPELADKIAAIRDPYVQARIATTAFQGAGEAMLPFLRRGAAGLREYTIMAQRYGVGNAAAVGAANQFRMAQTRVALAVEGLSNSVAVQLAPVITPLLGQMAEWIAANRDWIATGIGREVRQFAAYVAGINWAAVGQGVHGWIDGIGYLVQSIGGWHTAIGGVIGIMAAPLLSSVATVATALFSLAANPIGAAVLAVGGLAYAGYQLYQHWDDVKAKFSGLWDGLKTMFADNTGYIRTAAELLFPLPLAIVGHWNDLKDYFPRMWDSIKESFNEGWSYIRPIIEKVQNGANWIANSWVGKKLGYAASEIGAGVSSAAGAVQEAATSAVQAAPTLLQRGVAALDNVMGFGQTNPGARGIRNNNPLNLSYVPGQQGVTGSDGRFGQYGSMADGVAAAERQLLRYQAQGTDTIAKMITRWAPANENETGSYITQVSKWTGIDAGAKVDMRDPLTAQKIIGAMARRESGGVNANEVQMGVGLALGGVPPPAIARAPGAPPQAIAGASGAPRQMPIAVASAPERQIASQPPSVSSADLKAAMNSRVNIDINGRTPPGISVTATGSDNVNLGGGLVQQSRLGMVAG